jgi:hypothetical protein
MIMKAYNSEHRRSRKSNCTPTQRDPKNVSVKAVEKLKVKVNVEVEFTLEQAMKAQRGSRGILLLFL